MLDLNGFHQRSVISNPVPKGFAIKGCLSAVFSPQNSKVNHVTSPDAPPAAAALPPPLPVKSREARPQEPPSPTLWRPADAPSDSPPPLARSSTARVSFREPISSCYSLEEDEDDEEGELQQARSSQQDVDEGKGSSGNPLHLQDGVPPQMDLLGEEELPSVESVLVYCCSQKYEAYPSINLHASSSLIPSSTQMDSLPGEVGAGAASLKTRFSTREQRGAVGAPSPPGLGWTPWNQEERKAGISRNPMAPRLLPSKPAGTNTKTAAPPVPHHQTLRKRAISWDNPYRCPLSSENISLRRAERGSGGGRGSETGG